jgi:hypothetical protein
MDGNVKFYDVRKGQVIEDYISQPVQRFALANSKKAYAVSATNNTI